MAAKTRRILLLPDAVEDIQGILDPVYSEIVQKLRLLKRFPYLGSPLPAPFVGWRHLPVRMFRIIYRVVPRGVEIAYVRHCKRRMPSLIQTEEFRER